MSIDANMAALSICETAATLRSHGFSDEEINNRLIEVAGLRADTAKYVVSTLPDFLQETGGAGRVAGPPRVFITHSHHDRETASLLQIVLEQNKILTFLDQHEIVAGQELKDRLIKGLVWCDQLLLVWSAHADRSGFVGWEWQRAHRLTKGVLPYVLDNTPLPDVLKGIRHIDRTDKEHGHAELLRAILGRQWKPDTATPFPGLWHVEVNLLGFGEAWYKIELRANGQVIGHGGIKQTGYVDALARTSGLSDALRVKIPLTGTWSYDERGEILEINTTAHFMGQVQRDVVRIQTTGKEKGWLQGHTLGGIPWRMKRAR